ncbi:MAG: hypothetical protein UX19_C0005G0018 [Candidatus Woesebacteria bacterium GW2011_GWA1_45_8]|uniref:TrbL/VirB6 plasmid conjugal transfer protein n=1 Tax=Candidatus Woesebacteria bacterium GW2011_GWA1_45_8 TaxID=1618559 RepID=A0A0G1MV60_9BACT|nr:MAG: hypothetical protein UX19_C0005G0018 [Candidatus Woesebacteria bacterium GW2011_GWA1_45_8]
MFKKLLASVLIASQLLIVSSFLFVTSTRAQTTSGPWYNQTFEQWATKVYDTNQSPESEIFGERYTAAQVQWVIYGLVAFFTMAGEQEVFSCLSQMQDPADIVNCVDEIQAAAQDILTQRPNRSFLAIITSSPVSGVAYVKDVASRLNLVPEAMAQSPGFGFGAAAPVLGLWRVVRNITYFLLVIITVVLAFMIMFRVKISPQTIVTVQSALPKIIIAIVLITFSYAIAGFLIDLMYVVIGLLAAILSTSGLVTGNYAQWQNMFAALTEGDVFTTLALYWLWFMTALWVALFSSGVVAALTAVLSFFIYPILMIIMGIILLIAWFKIIWLLLKTFVNILLLIVFGPIQLLLGAVYIGGFGPWIRGLVSNLVVYPTVGFMSVLAFVFLRGAFWDWEGVPPIGAVLTPVLDTFMPFGAAQIFSGGSWNPPLTFAANQTELLWLGASLVTILLIPNIANIIKGFVERRPFAYGTAIGEAFGPMAATGKFIWGTPQAGLQASTRGAIGRMFGSLTSRGAISGTKVPGGLPPK